MTGLVLAHHLEHLLALGRLALLVRQVGRRVQQRAAVRGGLAAVVRRVVVERVGQQPARVLSVESSSTKVTPKSKPKQGRTQPANSSQS